MYVCKLYICAYVCTCVALRWCLNAKRHKRKKHHDGLILMFDVAMLSVRHSCLGLRLGGAEDKLCKYICTFHIYPAKVVLSRKNSMRPGQGCLKIKELPRRAARQVHLQQKARWRSCRKIITPCKVFFPDLIFDA